MKRTQWLAEKVRELDEQDFSEFRRWFLEYDTELWQEQVERTAKHRAVDPLIVEALTEYEASRKGM
jgi:succinate dehydrogenase flavin-adding protein (antitoxin of CptAB toxin-antitoxin module)